MSKMDTAIILAGGKSNRMGFDKQRLVINNRWIMLDIIEELKKEFNEIIVVSNNTELYNNINYNIKVVEDEVIDFGPLGGIYSGLKKSTSMYNYLIACDMPFINIGYIRYLKSLLSNEDIDILITLFRENMFETFNAFYSKKIIPIIKKAIDEDRRKITTIFKQSNTMYVPEEAARKFSPDWSMFTNLNTKEDIENYITLFK